MAIRLVFSRCTLAPLFTGGTCHTIDSALVSAVITNNFDVDAWGTATMPDGNDYDALRVLLNKIIAILFKFIVQIL